MSGQTKPIFGAQCPINTTIGVFPSDTPDIPYFVYFVFQVPLADTDRIRSLTITANTVRGTPGAIFAGIDALPSTSKFSTAVIGGGAQTLSCNLPGSSFSLYVLITGDSTTEMTLNVEPEILTHKTLNPFGSFVWQFVSDVEVSQHISLGVSRGECRQLVDSLYLDSIKTAKTRHAQYVDSGLALTVQHVLTIPTTESGHTSTFLTLEDVNFAQVKHTQHAQSVTTVVLQPAIGPRSTLHRHLSPCVVELEQGHVLSSVATTRHDSSSQVITLEDVNFIQIKGTRHVQSVDGIELTQGNVLRVKKALHAHMVEAILMYDGVVVRAEGKYVADSSGAILRVQTPEIEFVTQDGKQFFTSDGKPFAFED